MTTMGRKLVLCATIVCACFSGLASAQQSTTEEPGTGEVSLSRYCSFAALTGRPQEINCLIDSNDPDSTVYWSLVTPDGQTLDLGRCTGMRNTCRDPLSPDVTLFRWYSWNTVNFRTETYRRPGSTLRCTATHFGHNRTDSCVPAFPAASGNNPAVSTTTTTTTTTAPTTTTARPKTGDVVIDAYCSFPGQRRISCHIDSDDPRSAVQWALLTSDLQVQILGNCSGLRGSCRAAPGSNVTLSRWYSWSSVQFPANADLSGSRLFCAATHRGAVSVSSCPLEDPNAPVNDCIRGRDACYSRGWQRNTGSINGVAVCCPPRADNLGLSINMNHPGHTCLCPR